MRYASFFVYIKHFLEPILVVISFVPFGDLLGYLRKSRGHEDYYYNDSDMMPKISLTSRELIRFAKDIACGMEFLEANKVFISNYIWFICFRKSFYLVKISTS